MKMPTFYRCGMNAAYKADFSLMLSDSMLGRAALGLVVDME